MRESEDTLGLQRIRCADAFDDTTAVVVTQRLTLQRAIGQKIQMGTLVAFAHDSLACSHLRESELGMGDDLHQIGSTHALEECKLQQLVVDGHCSILSFMEGEYHTLFCPLSS